LLVRYESSAREESEGGGDEEREQTRS